MHPPNDELTRKLQLVEDRLSETWEALSVQRVINEHANKGKNPRLNVVINIHPGFWRVINFSLQSSIIIGLFALLDIGPKRVSMYSILSHAEHRYPGPSLEGFRGNLNVYRARYKTYRHNIFAHNNVQRRAVIETFNREGFTWSGLESDLADIDHIWKTIWFLHCRSAPPTREQSRLAQFPHNTSRAGVTEHTLSFLTMLSSKGSCGLEGE